MYTYPFNTRFGRIIFYIRDMCHRLIGSWHPILAFGLKRGHVSASCVFPVDATYLLDAIV